MSNNIRAQLGMGIRVYFIPGVFTSKLKGKNKLLKMISLKRRDYITKHVVIWPVKFYIQVLLKEVVKDKTFSII